MSEFKLTFDTEEWNQFSGEQKLAIRLLQSIVRDLDKEPTAKLVAEVQEWLETDDIEPFYPEFCNQLLELDDGVIAAHMRRKLEKAKLDLVMQEDEFDQ